MANDKLGYRYSLDPFLLVDFAHRDKGCCWVDLGVGEGVMPVLLAGAQPSRKVTGIEVQGSLADKALRLVERAGLMGQIEIVHGDLRHIRELFPAARYDAVLTNPPYRRTGTGRIAPDGERAAARHELHGGLADFVAAAAYLLKPGGRCYLIYLPERLVELLTLLAAAGLEPKRLRCVHGRAGTEARMVLVEACRGGRTGLRVEPPLTVFAETGYTAEVAELFQRWRELLPASAGG